MAIATRRKSRYVDLVREVLTRHGHATNGEIAAILRQTYPRISDTTVHRITQRLIHDGECVYGPVLPSGVKRYDGNLLPHDHFECSCCHTLRDLTLPAEVRRQIEYELKGCTLDGQLLIIGNCHKCKQKEEV